MDWQARISLDPGILGGKPTVRGTRLSVEFLLELMASDLDEAAILEAYPQLGREDLQACLAYAAFALKSEKVYPIPA